MGAGFHSVEGEGRGEREEGRGEWGDGRGDGQRKGREREISS